MTESPLAWLRWRWQPPVRETGDFGNVVELADTPPFQGGDCGFDPRRS